MAPRSRYASKEAYQRSQAASNAAKRKRTGRCVDCGTTTRYNGHGIGASERCLRCAAALVQGGKRGTGPTGRLVLARLQDGPATFTEIGSIIGGEHKVGQLVARLMRYGLIVRLRRGVYTLPENGDRT